ncbi:O-antigen ligase family protein [Neobacillus mesonae]|nr:O-antigen ligase family protein [Neobacillus mesonae]
MFHADKIGMAKRNNSLSTYSLQALGLLTAVTLAYACFHQGLYFSGAIEWISGLFFSALFILWLLIGMNVPDTRGVLLQGTPLLLIPLLMAILYAWHLVWGHPLSGEGTRDHILQFAFISFFAAGCSILGRHSLGKRQLSASFQMLGWLMTLSGLLAVCGLLVLPFSVMRTADSLLSASGARLAGLLEYPNAYGVLVGMFFLERLKAAASAFSSSRAAAYSGVVIASLALFPAATALLLSESRGAWLSMLLCGLVLFLLQRPGLRLPLLCASAPPLFCAALAHHAFAGAALAPAPLPGLLMLAGGELAALLGTLLLNALLARGHQARAACLAAAALSGAAALVIITAMSRITSGATWFAREAMWEDAVLYGLRSPWLGHGGDAWKHAVYTVQSKPYIGTEVHSSYLDIFVDTGLMGLLLMLLLFAYILWLLWTQDRTSIPVSLLAMVHGAIDFDFSYPLFWMVLVLLAAWKLPVSEPESAL